jgi:hypothetical protein
MLGLKVTVSDIPKTNVEVSSCFVNIYENMLPVSPTTALSDHDIGLSHFAKEPIRKAEEIISARYHRTNGTPIDIVGSIGVKSNRMPDANKWIKTVAPNFKYPTLNLLITGSFNDLGEPLFWRHEIPLASINFGVTITDQDGNIVPTNKYKLITEADPMTDTHDALRGVVAHHLSASPDHDKYYLVNYRDSNGNIVQEILDQRPLFTKFPPAASIFTWSQNPNASLLHYWVVPDGPLYAYSLPDDYGNCAFREYHTSYVRAYLPYSLGPNEPWFPLVPNFTWIRQDESLFKVPEWDLQNFCSSAPYVCISDDVSTVLGKHLIRVSNPGVLKSHEAIDTEYIKLVLYQENDSEPTKALTNNPALDGVLVDNKYDVEWEYTPLSVIGDLGIIYSPVDIGFYSWCFADYPYESYSMPVLLKDLNPFRDSSLRTKTIVFYLVPNFVGQDRAVEYIAYDEDLMVVETSQDGLTSNNPDITPVINAGLLYDLPEGVNTVLSGPNTLGVQVQVVNNLADDTFIKKYVEGDKYIILGEFSFPETLDESANALVTDVREQTQLDPIDMRLANPDALSILPDSVYNEIVSMQALQGLQEYRCHWAFFTDYNTGAMFSKAELDTRLESMKMLGISSVVTYEGVPGINVKSFNVADQLLTIHWLPVSYFDRNTVTGGILYKSTDPNNIETPVVTIADLAKTSEYTVAFAGDEELFFKIVPQVTIDGTTYTGPDSNILYFSFRR